MKNNRPVDLTLSALHFPPTAIASILHRIAGIILFLFIPFALWMLDKSLATPNSFALLSQMFAVIWFKSLVFIGLSAWSYHFIAGIRHLLMDCGLGESVEAGTRGTYIVWGLTIIFIVLIGIKLW